MSRFAAFFNNKIAQLFYISFQQVHHLPKFTGVISVVSFYGSGIKVYRITNFKSCINETQV
ncbi:hypothetical protein BKM17_23135 [Pseudomonas syringae group genomosp. 3]|nr:hypothetical protein BKM17_23135 [Pseudomonas syringae group genomosp. 3]